MHSIEDDVRLHFRVGGSVLYCGGICGIEEEGQDVLGINFPRRQDLCQDFVVETPDNLQGARRTLFSRERM